MKLTALKIACATMTTILLSSCAARVNSTDCQYAPWPIDEYQLFGLEKGSIVATYPVQFSNDGKSIMFIPATGQRFNLEFNDEGKVCAVQRYFIGCGHTYRGPWLPSQKEALDYCIASLSKMNDVESTRKMAVAKLLLAKLNTKE